MKCIRRAAALVLSFVLLLNFAPRLRACGPAMIEPVFVFEGSPDLPFAAFASGKIGIVRPTFGRKTLSIAYRYLNGGTFTSDEQQALVEALRGKGPEDESDEPVKKWIAARKELAREGEKLPDVYTERAGESYDFFPNCAKNAFEVAAATLKDRVAKFGADDRGVRTWIATQDTVFQNCAAGGSIPEPLGPESPQWLRKDRDYQIGASLFYSLNFDEARARFEMIANDAESDWRRTADYLVARTLVRQASLIEDEARKRELYEQAEIYLQIRVARDDQFSNASRRLLGLVKYRLHPEERVQELGDTLANGAANENLRQDLIDYVWLLDKFEAEALRAEEKRLKESKGENAEVRTAIPGNDTYEAVQRGELISIGLTPKFADGKPDYTNQVSVAVKCDTPEADLLQTVEGQLHRKLTPEEITEVRTQQAAALEHRSYLLAPNRKVEPALDDHERCYSCYKIKLASGLLPPSLRLRDLSDWILTLQMNEPESYAHAVAKWRETQSPAWLVTALTKAEKDSTGVQRLLREAQKLNRDSPAYPSVAYHLVRLQIALGKKTEARTLLDEIITSQFEGLPVSAQNQFREQRMQVAESLSELLKFAQRQPATFYYEGSFGTIRALVDQEKGWWSDGGSDKQTKEEYEQQIEDRYKSELEWTDRFIFDEKTVDILNWHVPLAALAEEIHDPALPDYQQRRLALVVWTRAILLDKDDIARSVAADAARAAPAMEAVFNQYLKLTSTTKRKRAALFVLLKFPGLSPFIEAGLPNLSSGADMDYYFETAWWCTPANTEYTNDGDEVPKVVPRPSMFSSEQFESARQEHVALAAIGNGSSYLGKRAIEWAKAAPDDPRIPEALFIAVKANESYKYGCNSWEADDETRQEAEQILRERYPDSPWTAKLGKPEAEP
jgi:hypothetical protein